MMPENTYAEDLAFLRSHTDVVELTAGGDARLAVVPAYQGRVMTSTLAGGEGLSYGWVNVPFIESGVHDDPVFNNYGGEDRFWIGPEAGQFALWYANGEPFDLDHWKTPPGFSTGPFRVSSQGEAAIALEAEFGVTNYSGTHFQCGVKRTINVLDAEAVTANLGTSLPAGATVVAYQSDNTLTNVGADGWTRAGGLVGIWILGMMKAWPKGKVIIPFRTGDEAELGPKATTDYFGALSAERCTVGDDFLWFHVNGLYRAKIGVSPARATGTLGAYDPDGGTLNIVQFTLPENAAELPYVNSLWAIQDAPFAGDAINAYNDGGLETPGGIAKTFFEMESSSPAAELAPGQSISHLHRTYHFAGEFGALNELARKTLGVDLAELGTS